MLQGYTWRKNQTHVDLTFQHQKSQISQLDQHISLVEIAKKANDDVITPKHLYFYIVAFGEDNTKLIEVINAHMTSLWDEE